MPSYITIELTLIELVLGVENRAADEFCDCKKLEKIINELKKSQFEAIIDQRSFRVP